MISSKKELRFYILADRIMAGKDKKDLRQRIIDKISPSANLIPRYLKQMRYCQYYKHQKGFVNLLLFIWHFRQYSNLGLRLGFSIGYDVFGYGLHIPHSGTIVVNNQSKIGNYCVLHTSVCIGGAGKIIGDGLYVGSGAMIMGSISLGDGISIASQSLVNKSLNDNYVLLAGVPATVKKKRKIWYEEEQGIYKERVERIEKLKKEYGC